MTLPGLLSVLGGNLFPPRMFDKFIGSNPGERKMKLSLVLMPCRRSFFSFLSSSFFLLFFFFLPIFSRVNDENRWMDTPERGGSGGGNGSTKSARKMFGSIERGLDRVRLMLTPRRRQLQRLASGEADGSGPNVVSNKVRMKSHSSSTMNDEVAVVHTLLSSAFTLCNGCRPPVIKLARALRRKFPLFSPTLTEYLAIEERAKEAGTEIGCCGAVKNRPRRSFFLLLLFFVHSF